MVTAVGVVDGRTLRRERNLQAAVDAVLGLLEDGHPQPTAQQVAERSGVSMRSIFRIFEDMESLHAAAVARQAERIQALAVVVPDDATTAERIDALVAARSRLFETIGPVRRSGLRQAASSPAIAAGLHRADRALRAEVQHVLQLDDGPELDGADAVTSFEAWDRLRTAQGLSRAGAERTLTLVLTRLLGA
jgi:TetR/AcrR family transcriptional regulator, regulator of autoinduction and epiphytic fitness